jgi:hypothetical protein
MPDVRKFSDAEINRLVKFYEQAEREILVQINKTLLAGKKDELEYLKQMRQNIDAILRQLREGNKEWCMQAIPNVYSEGMKNADVMLKDIGATVTAGFGAIHQQAAQVLAENTFQRFEDVVQVIGRQVNDIYRELALENVRGTVVGYDTWNQTARRFREQLAERGVTGFKDRSGKMWNMRTYTEMVARTTTMQAHLEGTANRLVEQGHDLIKVSTHRGACPLCEPWQGKVLSITGKTKGYPTLEEAKADGLFHPNCRHAYGLYIDLDKEIEELEMELEAGETTETELYNDSLLKESKDSVFEKMLKEYSAEYKEKLTDDEIEAIIKYQSTWFIDINGFLRGRLDSVSRKTKTYVKNLQKAIEKVTIKENILVARGTTLSAIGGDWNAARINDIITDEGFTSTSLTEKTAIDFVNRKGERGILMYVKIPKGTNGVITDVAVNDNWENELLLAPGTKIRITGKRIENGMKIVEGVVVNE